MSPLAIDVLRPMLRYSHGRNAYVLRFVGAHRGPVLRPDRRRRATSYDGPERRGAGSPELYSEHIALH